MKGKWKFFERGFKAKINSLYGRVNFYFDLGLLFIAIFYFSSDTIKQFMFLTASVIKSWRLNQDIQYAYHETNFLRLVSPALIVTVLCLILLSIHENKKLNVKRK